MRILVSYVIQGEKCHRYNSEVLDLNLVPPLYSPEPPDSVIENEIVKWVNQKQCRLSNNETIIVLKTLKA